MRVALVTSPVAPIRPAEANGPHAVVVDLARGLRRRGHEAIIYAAEGSVVEGVEVIQVVVDPRAAEAAVRVGARPPAGATAALEEGFARMFALLARDRPDVISQHAFDAAALRAHPGPPMLHTLHLAPIDAGIVAAARQASGPLATVSAAMQRCWQDATNREVVILRNGVRELEPARGAIVPVALIAGRIAPEKGTDIAIRVARRAGLAVLVVGDVYDADYHRQAVAPLLRPGEWIGPVSREELFQLMARSAVLLMPVRWDEAFGLVAAEAQMAGCPVVAYRRGALPEVVEQGVGGWLVDPDDEAMLLTAVRPARGLDRDRIRARARRRLGVERMVAAYERVLIELAAQERADIAS
jgi:glycosyltransferase involved in cell wall biosynthesis